MIVICCSLFVYGIIVASLGPIAMLNIGIRDVKQIPWLTDPIKWLAVPFTFCTISLPPYSTPNFELLSVLLNMSDTGRQSFVDKATNALKPDSNKTGPEEVKHNVIGGADDAAAAVQPNSEKSSSQKFADSISGNSGKKSTSQKFADNVSGNNNNESLVDKAKNAVGMGNNK